ncbi:hypothetical protein OF83DRAFT_1250200 [Amylostereum chailletii]|nr:hypothetical protein OF83DRAFT_1250200 [Amylostereum chailletii]
MATSAVNANLSETVTQIFRRVWDEFYEWHDDYCRLATIGVPRAEPDEDALWARDLILGLLQADDSDAEELPPTPTEEDAITVVIDGGFDECPPYESCTPLGQSVYTGDGPAPVQFLPFASDPTFDHAHYLNGVDALAWQVPSPDPNVEFIALETAARLQESHGMSMRMIDDTHVLPWRLLPHDDDNGLLQRGSQRDFHPWPKPTPARLYARAENTRPPRAINDLYARVEAMHRVFCPSLSCVRAACALHPSPRPMRALDRIRYKTDDFATLVDVPCGQGCFLSDAPRDATSIDWSPGELADLRGVLRIEPDGIPCDLAVVVRKPCWEVLHMRPFALPTVLSKPKPRRRGPLKRALKMRDDNPDSFTPIDPCTHPGPCDATTQCPCWRDSLHCERNCHCPDACKRRWRGCRCKATSASRAVCGTTRCPCVEAGRECDFELCGPCGARGRCANADIQYGREKRLEVRVGEWGFGLALLERARESSFICEYVGEAISQATVDSREYVVLARHRGRNYVFGLNATASIDSLVAGNVARYINHAKEGRANCYARVRYVNADHRIGIFAGRDIEAGEELLMDYGDDFFRVSEESTDEGGWKGVSDDGNHGDESDWEGAMDVDD